MAEYTSCSFTFWSSGTWRFITNINWEGLVLYPKGSGVKYAYLLEQVVPSLYFTT